MEPEQIAAALVVVTQLKNGRWMVTIGTALDYWRMMYDRKDVADSFAGAVRAVIVEGIRRANGADTPHVVTGK